MRPKKYIILVLFLSLVMVYSCSSSDNEVVPVTDIDKPIEWETVWEDNFDGTSLNTDDWDVWEGGAYNDELQLYRNANIRVEGGFLHIDSKRETVMGPTTNVNPEIKSFDFTSGRLETKRLYSPSSALFNGGVKFSVRVKVGVGEGVWPSFWSFSDPWPTQGEINIYSIKGNNPNTFYSKYQFGSEPGVNQAPDNATSHSHSESLGNDFHDYEVEWTRDNLKIYFDGNLVNEYTSSFTNFINELYSKRQKVIINGAIGGNVFDALDTSTIPDNVTHTIDWIRVSRIKL